MPTLRVVYKNGQIVDTPVPVGTTKDTLGPFAVGPLAYLKVPATATTIAKNQNLAEIDDWTVIPDPVVPPPPPPPPPSGTGLAALYPGDKGIEADPSVVWVERFDEVDIPTLGARWTDKLLAGMTFDADAPPKGTRSLVITPPAGAQIASSLYKVLSPGVADTLYVREYRKYVAGNPWHGGSWLGGNNPPSAWPSFPSNTKPTGADWFSMAFERQPDGSWSTYDYWGAMHPDGAGGYYGDVFKPNPMPTTPLGQWVCVEQMIKLNNPVTGFGGEQALWLDGTLVLAAKLGLKGVWGPLPAQNPGIFTVDPLSTSSFEGFQWRTNPALLLNVIWLQNYAPTTGATMKFANVVAATKYIGPLA